MFQFIQIPKSTNVIVTIDADLMHNAIRQAKLELDLSQEWVIYADGTFKGFLVHNKFSCTHSDTATKTEVKRYRDMSGSRLFDSPAEALADRKKHESEANAKLDVAEAEFNALMNTHNVTISYSMQGDTHGIYEDYMYISVEVSGYYFERRLNQ